MQKIRLGSAVPAGQVPAWLASQRKSYYQAGATPGGQQVIVRDEVAGEDFRYSASAPGGKGTVTSRTQHFLRGQNYYALTVMSPAGAALPADADRFFSAFHFLRAQARTGGPAGPAGGVPAAGAPAAPGCRP